MDHCYYARAKKVDYLKSINLQYITLGCLDDGTNESLTKSEESDVQSIISFMLIIDLGHSKLFIFIFLTL